MSLSRSTAMTAGVFYLLTEVAAIAATACYAPILNHAGYISGPGADDRILLGALFEVLLIVAAIGTAVTLYPVVRRQNESVALAFVVARVLETTAILVGILSLLAVVSVRRDYAAGSALDDGTLAGVGSSLQALHDWSFLLGPNFALGAASVLLAHLLFVSRLVPRAIAVLGLVGGTLIVVSAVAVMFGAYEQMSTTGFVVALPVFAWELALAGWLIVKGFAPVSIVTG